MFLCCKDEGKLTQEPVKPMVKYDMYQPSEMADFMNLMYAYNQQLKAKIMDGEVPNSMSLDLLKLHSAEMTDGKSRSQNWKSFVNVFIASQEAVVDTLSNKNLKDRYNEAINNCLNCHKTECTGPIPRIKKLLIQ
ncbi:hypothetical protein DFQ11_10357 [Winogradskyella epiphytica]|uniref:Uncharacterized protein n=3 Tax=Winogradskyella epiphytica TaxID=262005 RepID=A0A2V4YCQ0_9FLAO|nr:hypothetical protein DFQ11_10357 [Winogradskyella epiphytica]GGW65940.1 hypothetical protein GCM10008085_17200 [Winogradskyella epiphytica]